MEIKRVIPSGYCKGVVHAIKLAEETRKNNPQDKIHVLGMIVHNSFVTDELARIGIITLDDSSKTKEVLEREKALKTWLENRSLLQILAWFDAVTETMIQTPFARRRVTTETTARDELFLKMLGVITD